MSLFPPPKLHLMFKNYFVKGLWKIDNVNWGAECLVLYSWTALDNRMFIALCDPGITRMGTDVVRFWRQTVAHMFTHCARDTRCLWPQNVTTKTKTKTKRQKIACQCCLAHLVNVERSQCNYNLSWWSSVNLFFETRKFQFWENVFLDW